MKRYTKPLISCLLGVAAVTLAGCGFFNDKFVAKPEVLAQLNKSETRTKMRALDVTSVELTCPAGKVVGKFTFLHIDGRDALTVAGDTPCAQAGWLVSWDENELTTRADYAPAMVTAEVDKLLAKSKLAPQAGNSYNHDVSEELRAKYMAALPGDWRYLAFSCDKAGDRYEYVTYSEREKVTSGTLKTTCAAPHQNFAVSVIPASSPTSKPTLLVRQFNNAPPAALSASFAELLGSRLPATKF